MCQPIKGTKSAFFVSHESVESKLKCNILGIFHCTLRKMYNFSTKFVESFLPPRLISIAFDNLWDASVFTSPSQRQKKKTFLRNLNQVSLILEKQESSHLCGEKNCLIFTKYMCPSLAKLLNYDFSFRLELCLNSILGKNVVANEKRSFYSNTSIVIYGKRIYC